MSIRMLSALLALILLASCGPKEPPPAGSGPEVSSRPLPPSSSQPEEPPSEEEAHRQMLIAAVEETIARYNNGTVAVTENISALPEGFVFPAERDWSAIDITKNEVTGDFRVRVPAGDGEQMALFVCCYFTVESGGETPGLECHVTHVLFE